MIYILFVLVSLDCPFLIAPSIFSNFYFLFVSCAHMFALVPTLSYLDCLFGIL